ncbi:MAG: hypothetical protein Q7R41_18075 [Phycisphaerales bacterium]|nr:hypothetical protein [Phycisphaerales bacterium]
MDNVDISNLTNDELIRRTEELAADLRTKTCELVESLVELDRRKLYLDSGPSLFEYCVSKLKMSEAAAYRRIRAARAFQAYPPVKSLLRSGKLTLESLTLLHPFLNDADAGKLVAEASGMRIWEVDRLVAPRRTEPPRRDVVRFIAPIQPAPTVAAEIAEATLFEPPAVAQPEVPAVIREPKPTKTVTEAAVPAATVPAPAPGIRVGFTADAAFFVLLREAQAAMRHKYPDGRLDGIFRDALKALLKKKRPWAPRPATSPY